MFTNILRPQCTLEALRFFLLSVLMMVLAACGAGGDLSDSSAATGVAKAVARAASTKDAATTATTWVLCAQEGRFCSFPGTRAVRYGTDTVFATGTYTNLVLCSYNVFGDPAYGVTKSCSYAADPPDPNAVWVQCGTDNGGCPFVGTMTVRYGTATAFITGTFTNGVQCATGVFGDPAPGQVKTCSYLSTTGSTTTPTTTTPTTTSTTTTPTTTTPTTTTPTTTTPTTTTPTTTTPTTTTTTYTAWVLCAQEGRFCSFPGTRAVRYGTDTVFATGTYTNLVLCSYNVFGDPAYGVTKSCSYAADPPDPNAVWVQCGTDNGGCPFVGTMTVRYGTATAFITGTFTNGVQCATGVFGDPAPGQVKTCSYLSTTGSTTTPTTTTPTTTSTTTTPTTTTPTTTTPTTTTPTTTTPTTTTPTTTTTTYTAWVLCAQEGRFCSFPGTRAVRYGTDTVFATGTYTNLVLCSYNVFGDPAYGVTKSCSYAADPPDPNAVWVQCGTDNGGCPFVGTMTVRYGTATAFITGTFTNGVQCATGVFGDPAPGQVKTCSYLSTTTTTTPTTTTPTTTTPTTTTPTTTTPTTTTPTTTTPTTTTPTTTAPTTTTPGSSGSNPPIVFNASSSVHAGDVISLQGAAFGSAPTVYLDGAPTSPLTIVNSTGDYSLAVQIPSTATGAIVLRVSNGTGVSAAVPLNGARPMHLDALQLVPGGAFRIFGRSLLAAGYTPTVTLDGQPATINLASSDEYMLTVVAPATLSPTPATVIKVDNGNGTGPAQLDRTIEVVASGGGDPFALNVGWATAFNTFASNTINAATDSRLGQRVACNGSQNDTPAIQAAMDLAASTGGGVVRLPAGNCVLATTINMRPRVVLQGAGKTATQLIYQSNYSLYAIGVDLWGISDFTLTNSGSATEAPLLKNNTRMFIRNVRIQLGTSRQAFMSNNRNVSITGSDFIQTGSISQQGPYILNDSSGMVYEGNTTQWMMGAPAFGDVHDSYIHANHFTRDGSSQNSGGTIHAFTIDFAYRIAIIGNTFDVVNGPITNKNRNDGETILTEGGGAARTENLGTVASSTANSISDPSNTFQFDPFGTGSLPENYGVAIVSGTGAGQTRLVTAGNGTTLTVDRAWDVIPDTSSHYATFVWGLDKALIKDNVLAQNPRGIWLYQTAIRDVDVVGNTISEGGGIFLRAYQNLSQKYFMPLYNIVIAKNTITNTTGNWMSYINAVFTNSDARAFGIAMLGIEMRSNAITANIPNVYSVVEDYAGTEGYSNLMRVENFGGYESSSVPRILGTILTNDLCTNCDVAVRIGTGAGGTTIVNERLVNSATLLTDTAFTVTSEKSTGTVVK